MTAARDPNPMTNPTKSQTLASIGEIQASTSPLAIPLETVFTMKKESVAKEPKLELNESVFQLLFAVIFPIAFMFGNAGRISRITINVPIGKEAVVLRSE